MEVEHIDDWAKVKEHRFENLIALCPTCHTRKGDKAGQIDRLSLRQYKANLAVLNYRYGDLERRLLEAYAERRKAGQLLDDDGDPYNWFQLGAGSELLLRYLIKDGYLEKDDVVMPKIGEMALSEVFRFTSAGDELVDKWISAQPIDPPSTENEEG